MAKLQFTTVPTELVEHAEAAHSYFSSLGYRLNIEPTEAYYPSTPTLQCKRAHTRLTVHICGRINIVLIREWVQLAKTLHSDERIAICIPEESQLKHLPKHQVELRSSGVGIYVSREGTLLALNEPADQNTPAGLPDLSRKRAKIRQILGQSYEHFEAGRWREGFDEACRSLEQTARAYLVKAFQSGRLTSYNKQGVPQSLNAERINRLTLGQLAVTLGSAQPLNSSDSILLKALTQINKDRVGITHKNKSPATERSLRKNVGLHMHVILRALEDLVR